MAVREMPDFDMHIINEPLELLTRVKSLMHVPMKSKYPPLTLIEVLCSFLAIKQGENEELIDYISRFKSEKSVLLGLMGTKFLDGFTENSLEYKTYILPTPPHLSLIHI